MTLYAYCLVLQRRWRWLATGSLLSLLAAGGVVLSSPPTWTAAATVWIAPSATSLVIARLESRRLAGLAGHPTFRATVKKHRTDVWVVEGVGREAAPVVERVNAIVTAMDRLLAVEHAEAWGQIVQKRKALTLRTEEARKAWLTERELVRAALAEREWSRVSGQLAALPEYPSAAPLMVLDLAETASPSGRGGLYPAGAAAVAGLVGTALLSLVVEWWAQESRGHKEA